MRNKFKNYFVVFFLICINISVAQQNEIFIFPHTVSNLFTLPTAKTLRSFDIQANLGSHFNDAGIENFSGNINFGILNFAELQFSSSNSDISLFGSKNNLLQFGAKVSVFNESANLPGLAIGSEIQLGWNVNDFNESFLGENENDKFSSGLRSVKFSERNNQFYGVISKRLFSTFNLHLGVRLQQLFFRNFTTSFNYGNNSFSNSKINKNLVEYFGGFNFVLNGRTKFMLEIMSAPNLDIYSGNGKLSINRKTLINAGMRTFMNEWFVIDYGLHFDDKYNNLENIQLRVGLSAFWNVKI